MTHARQRRGIAIVATLTLIASAIPSYVQAAGVRKQFMGMHNLKNGGVEIVEGMEWTKTLVGSTGYILDWVTDFAPDAPVHWVGEAMKLNLVPCIRVQECNGGCTPDPGYPGQVAAQIVEWKLQNPTYADRLVYLQLWNEPGDSRDYVPMDVYADYLVEAYSVVHQIEDAAAAAYPSLDIEGTFKVMTPGQNGPSGWEDAFNHNPQAMYSFDVWATHPYPEATPPWHNVHDGDTPATTTKCIDSYLMDLDVVARPHGGVAGRRGFPIMITETAYGDHLGISYQGWPKTSRAMAADYNVDAFFTRWYQWPEIIAVHPFILNNWSWNAFGWVDAGSDSEDEEAPWNVREPTSPFQQYTDVKAAREDLEDEDLLDPAPLVPYTGAVGSIAGAVTRNDTGDPVPYATIYTNGYEFGHVTLYDGLYEVHDVPTGNYTLAFQKYGYAGTSQSITVSEDQTTTANFSVTYTGKTMQELYWVDTFAGDSGCNGCDLYTSYHTQSFKTGSDTGYIKYAACKPNIDGITMKFTIHSGSATGPQVGDPVYGTLESGVGGNMIGAEWDDGDEPEVSPNTTYWLRFERSDSTSVYCYASDDNPYADGQSGLNAGWDYYSCIRGLTEVVNTVTGTISGTVKDESQDPIQGVTVMTSPGGQSATTNASGVYTISDVPTGTTSVIASKAGYSTDTETGVTVTENQTTTVNFELETGPTTGTISGTITDATNTGPLSGALVETTDSEYDATTGANGTYSFTSVPPGTYTVQATKSGYMMEQETNVTVTAGDTSTVNLALSEETPFSGISNGNMEGGYFVEPDADHKTANSWNQYTLSGASKSSVTWLGGGAHSTNYVQDFYESYWTSGIYQQASGANIGNEYEASVWVKASAGTMKFWVGIDPTGGIDATSEDIEWSDEEVPGTTWTEISVSTVASSSTITMFVEAQNPSGGQNAYIDDADLDDLGAAGSTNDPEIVLSPAGLEPEANEGYSPSNDTFTVTNVGVDTLDYTITTDMSWINVSPSSGSSTGESDTITVSYSTAALNAGWYLGTITVTDPDAVNNPQTISVSLTITGTNDATVIENFGDMPTWDYTYDAGWGSAATWSIDSGGQSGNCLQAVRASGGSSSKVAVYDVSASTSYTLSVYIRCPSDGGTYWAECAYRLGNNSAQDFDQNPGAWTMVKKFDSGGTNGNGDVWTLYTANISTGAYTQISVGYKLGSSGGTGPMVQWDTLEIE